MKDTVTITERNDEDPIRLADVPTDLKNELEAEFNAIFYDNDSIALPYIYVDIPRKKVNPASLIRKKGRPAKPFIDNFGYDRRNQMEKLVTAAGWFMKVDEDDPEDDTVHVIISKVKDWHDPGTEYNNSQITKARKDAEQREKEWELQNGGDDEGDEFEVASEEAPEPRHIMVKEDANDNLKARTESLKLAADYLLGQLRGLENKVGKEDADGAKLFFKNAGITLKDLVRQFEDLKANF